jgi:hypothetical protein
MTRSLVGAAALTAFLTAACSGDDSPSSPSTTINSGGSAPTNPAPGNCAVPAPANLRVSFRMQSLIELSWDAVANSTGYTLLVGTSPTSNDIMRADMASTSYRYAAQNGRQYARVQARATCGAGAISNAIEYSVP